MNAKNAKPNSNFDDLDVRLKAATERLLNGFFSCVAEKDLDYITSNDLGVKPLITPLRKNKRFFENTVVADKVIGKAAAFLLILGGVQAVHGEIMSKSAIELLTSRNIYFTYKQEVLNILNRTKTDLCPMEKSVLNITDENEAFIAIENTIKILMTK